MRFTCTNEISLGRGLGSSSAAAVAGIVAANELLGRPLDDADMLALAARIEGHPDNSAAALYGGCQVVVHDGDRLVTSTVSIPERLSAVLFVPEMPMPTAEARSVLPSEISMQDAVFNMGRVGLLVNALASDDLDHLAVATQDRLHQPPRQAIFHPMRVIMRAALDAGARGAFLSGAGSTILALSSGREMTIGYEMAEAASKAGVDGDIIVTKPTVGGRAGGGVRGEKSPYDQLEGSSMKLRQLKLKNFRCYQEETVIAFDDLTVLVGKNDAGKSTIFDALDIFFEVNNAPDKEDLSVFSKDGNISISCTFEDYPSQLVIDTQRPTAFASEYLLNEANLVEITKIYDCTINRPRLVNVFAIAIHPTAEPYNDLHTLNNNRLKQRATSLGIDLSSVNLSVNTELRGAIWAHADDLRLQKTEVSLFQATESKKVWEQIKRSLPIYALFKSDRTSTDQDAEAQDPMKNCRERGN